MIAFKEFAIGKFVLRFYKTDHVWTCTVTENMLDEVKSELLLRELSDIGQAIEFNEDTKSYVVGQAIEQEPLYTHPMRELTDEEIYECHDKTNTNNWVIDFARAIARAILTILKKAREK